MFLWSAAWREPSPGLAQAVMKNCKCSCFNTSNLVAQRSSQEQVTHGMPFWFLDDGNIWCHPVPVLPSLQAFDTANAKIWSRKKSTKDRSHLLHLRSGQHFLLLEDQ